MQWNVLTSPEELDNIDRLSADKPVVIFKHSTRCGISSIVLRAFERHIQHAGIDTSYFHLLDLIRNRHVSDTIAEHYDVAHESPQLLVVKNGNVIHHASHSGIDAEKVVALFNSEMSQ